jgi:RimK family alpha-L-glutamate ligase
MKIMILGSRGGWHESELERALTARGAEPVVAPVTALAASPGGTRRIFARGRPFDDCAAVVVRAIPAGSLEQIIFRMDVLHAVARIGVPVINSARSIERTVDKYYTSALLDEAGLPTPRTLVCERFDDAMAGFAELGGDVVVKPLFGSEGRGMLRVSDPDLAYRTFRTLEGLSAIFYLQEFVPHEGRDIRALVVGGRVVAAMTREGPKWKTNIAQGARPAPVSLTDDLLKISTEAARVVEAEYAGVDLLPGVDGRALVLEVNGIPGWHGLQQTTTVDVAGAIAEHVLTLARHAADDHAPGPREPVQ